MIATNAFSLPVAHDHAMVGNVAETMAELEPEDFYLLSGVEQGMRFSEWVNVETIPEYAGLSEENADYRIDRCSDMDLIRRETIQYEGYQLTFRGYDALALHTFAERETLDGVGAPLGVGKESDVYEARSFEPLALKYHREGYTNSRSFCTSRKFVYPSRWHLSASGSNERAS